MKEFWIMARLELINMFGINEIRHSKNPQEKKKRRMLIVTFTVIGLILVGYASAGAYAMSTLGLADKIPMIYFLLTFVLQLALGLLKAKSMMYREKDLDMISCLPVSGVHVIAARIFRMYLEGVIITLGALLPSMIFYGVNSGAGAAFYIGILPACLILPILPTAIAAWIGILIAAVISRSRHKVLAEVLIMLVLVLGMFLLSSLLTTKSSPAAKDNESKTTVSQSSDEKAAEKTSELSEEEMKAQLAESAGKVMNTVESVFPPARIMGNVLAEPDYPGLLIYAGISLAALLLTVLTIGSLFFRISGLLVSVTKHREYQLESLRAQSVMTALVKKEVSRYTSSGIYISNTIIGPVLAVVFAISTAFFDPTQLISSANVKNLPFDLQLSAGIPYLIGLFFVMMSISACSLSMEGKNWWIPRSLPLSSKEILGSKLIFNLIILTPFYALTEIILLFTMRISLLERIWMLIIPGIAILFSVLFGMTLSLRFPKFHWENAAQVVKQSAASGLSIAGGIALLIPGVGAMILPKPLYRNLLNLAVVIILCVICLLLYRRICRADLARLEA